MERGRSDTAVDFFFDFVSPYSYLALVQAEEFARVHGVRWRLFPVVYGVLLDRTGLVGPVETESKRRYTLVDILRSAASLDVPLVGPPNHPFRSLAALRTVCVFRDDPRALPISVALARACWAEGKDLTDPDVIAMSVQAAGGDVTGLRQRIVAPEVKERLRRLTEDALDRGVFGVPTFDHRGELFWGHDRLSHLAARLDGEPPPPAPLPHELAARPRGADRRGSPARPTDG